MEYGRYKISYYIEIINIFLKKRVTGGRKKKNGMSKEHAVCRNAGRTVSASIRRQQEYRRDDQRAARPPVGGEVFIPEQPDPECRQHGLDVPDDGGLDLIDALEGSARRRGRPHRFVTTPRASRLAHAVHERVGAKSTKGNRASAPPSSM